jgi:sporulation protein YlmC with PRC-barrel domain
MTMKAAPSESWTVTNYYKQTVYDPKENKIGDIDDVLVDKSGKITGLMIGVGGFVGVGEKDVIVPFSAVKTTKKNDKWWLTADETKDNLKKGPDWCRGFSCAGGLASCLSKLLTERSDHVSISFEDETAPAAICLNCSETTPN